MRDTLLSLRLGCSSGLCWRLEAAEKRERTLYGTTDAKEISEVLDSYREFTELRAQRARDRRALPDNRQLLARNARPDQLL